MVNTKWKFRKWIIRMLRLAAWHLETPIENEKIKNIPKDVGYLRGQYLSS